jgi:cation diffusion facilitator family transporter
MYRIRVGRRIGSAALVADGLHARTDGFTSLAVVLGVVGVWLGFPLADPIVGLLISVAIGVLLWGTARDVGRRLLDGVDPDLVTRTEAAMVAVPGIESVDTVRLRWSGHRLHAVITVATSGSMTVARFHELEHAADHALRQVLPSVGTVALNPVPAHPH